MSQTRQQSSEQPPSVQRSLSHSLRSMGHAWLAATQRRQLRRVRLWEAGARKEAGVQVPDQQDRRLL